MVWQDIVLSVGMWIFVIALIPTLRGKEKPALSTSIVTSAVLAVFVLTYATLELWLSTIASAVIAVLWFVLAAQKYRKGK